MPWKYYSSSDASAPTLSGTAGDAITVLDACLINGYGAKTGLGWTKDFSGTNLAVYRMAAGNTRYYLRVDDNAPVSATEARLQGYETMSDANTGTNVFPTSGYCHLRKSSAASVTTRSWVLAGDERTFIMAVAYTGSYFLNGIYFGEIYSYVPNDAYGVALIGRTTANSANTYAVDALHRLATSASIVNDVNGHFLARDTTGLVVGQGFEKRPANSATGTAGLVALTGDYLFPNPADGSVAMVPIYVSSLESAQGVLRGRLRGMWCQLHSNFADYFAAGDTWSGTGDLTGKTFVYAGKTATNSSDGSTPPSYSTGHLIFEYSGTVAHH
jgi:hypothetical protein